MTMALHLVPCQKINPIWPLVDSVIDDACKYNGSRYNASDVLAELMRSEKQLWLAGDDEIKGVIITGTIQFPQIKCCMIDICTGRDLHEWSHMLPQIENWARQQQCGQMFFVARLGMEKTLKQHGYRKTHAFFEKDL